MGERKKVGKKMRLNLDDNKKAITFALPNKAGGFKKAQKFFESLKQRRDVLIVEVSNKNAGKVHKRILLDLRDVNFRSRFIFERILKSANQTSFTMESLILAQDERQRQT